MGRSQKGGEGVEVVADVGGGISGADTGVSQPTELATIQLSQRIDTVIIGSSGFWCAPHSAIKHCPRSVLANLECEWSAVFCLTKGTCMPQGYLNLVILSASL